MLIWPHLGPIEYIPGNAPLRISVLKGNAQVILMYTWAGTRSYCPLYDRNSLSEVGLGP